MNVKEFDWSECPAVWRDPERLSGVWAFNHTRVPISFLFDNLEAGATVDEFIDWYPGVTREHVSTVLIFLSVRSNVPLRLHPVPA